MSVCRFMTIGSNFGDIIQLTLGENGILIVYFHQSGQKKVGCELCVFRGKQV